MEHYSIIEQYAYSHSQFRAAKPFTFVFLWVGINSGTQWKTHMIREHVKFR